LTVRTAALSRDAPKQAGTKPGIPQRQGENATGFDSGSKARGVIRTFLSTQIPQRRFLIRCVTLLSEAGGGKPC
jgi:hypothetical protein